jgi:hypothetical protein
MMEKFKKIEFSINRTATTRKARNPWRKIIQQAVEIPPRMGVAALLQKVQTLTYVKYASP